METRMKLTRPICTFLVFGLLLAQPAQAQVRTVNTKISELRVFNSGNIYVFPEQAVGPVSCSRNFLHISSNLSEAVRDRQFSALLTAYTTNQTIQIAYDTDDCGTADSPVISMIRLGTNL